MTEQPTIAKEDFNFNATDLLGSYRWIVNRSCEVTEPLFFSDAEGAVPFQLQALHICLPTSSGDSQREREGEGEISRT